MTMVDWLALAVFALWLVPLYCYVVYPILCRTWSFRAAQWPVLADADLPPAIVVCVYHNEEKNLPAKLANCHILDYPKDKLRLLLVSDASTDGSDALVRADGRAELLRLELRGGKSAGLNAAMAHVSVADAKTIIVLTDANTKLAPDAVRRLADALADPTVASACGELTLQPATGGGRDSGEAWYWRGEQVLKRGESARGCLIGANGGLHVLRLRDWEPLPGGLLMEDLLIPLRLLEHGRAVYVSAARAREESAGSVIEYRRKVRIATANYAMLPYLLRLRLSAQAWFCLLSHKLLRWLFAPLLLPLLALTVVLLVSLPNWWLMGLPLILLLVPDATAGGLIGWSLITRLAHGLLMHLAFTVGAVCALAGNAAPYWEHDRG